LYALDSEQDSVGGTTRLSYAQVAQHHKEKVERMLREKQSSEQDKEKEKDRKKEGSSARVVQQHGDVRGWFLQVCIQGLSANDNEVMLVLAVMSSGTETLVLSLCPFSSYHWF
jgi:hypothetical protein